MTTYTPEQLAQILTDAGACIHDDETEVITRIANKLGLTVEDPKPEPGVYSLDGKPVILYGDAFNEDYQWFAASNTSTWAARNHDLLVNARVVPAEPVELGAGTCRDAWDGVEPWCEGSPRDLSSWDGLPIADQSDLGSFAHNLLAKYGHGTTTPSRDDVRAAVESAIRRTVYSPSDATFGNTTDAVMALLEGGKA